MHITQGETKVLSIIAAPLLSFAIVFVTSRREIERKKYEAISLNQLQTYKSMYTTMHEINAHLKQIDISLLIAPDPALYEAAYKVVDERDYASIEIDLALYGDSETNELFHQWTTQREEILLSSDFINGLPKSDSSSVPNRKLYTSQLREALKNCTKLEKEALDKFRGVQIHESKWKKITHRFSRIRAKKEVKTQKD